MIQLKKKLISQEDNLSSILFNRRKARNVSIQQVSLDLSIHPKYLKSLEKGDYSEFPEQPYNQQIIRKYCEYLNLNFKEIWHLYLLENKIFNELADIKRKNKKIKGLKGWKRVLALINLPRIVLNASFAVIILSVVAYFSWSVYSSVQPPYLEVLSPDDNLITKEYQIEIVGRTESGIKVTINGQAVVNDDSGFFKKEIELQEGINVIKVTAAKKHEYENTIYRQIMVVDNSIGLFNK